MGRQSVETRELMLPSPLPLWRRGSRMSSRAPGQAPHHPTNFPKYLYAMRQQGLAERRRWLVHIGSTEAQLQALRSD